MHFDKLIFKMTYILAKILSKCNFISLLVGQLLFTFNQILKAKKRANTIVALFLKNDND